MLLALGAILSLLLFWMAWGRSRRKERFLMGLFWLLALNGIFKALALPRVFEGSDVASALAPPAGPFVPVAEWFERAVLLYILAFGVTLVAGVLRGDVLVSRRGRLVWIGALLFSAGPLLASLFGGKPIIFHGIFLLPWCATCVYLVPDPGVGRIMRHVKGIMLVYVYGSLLALLVAPLWAMEIGYQGLLGVPIRLYGITPGANLLGPLVATYLILDLVSPLRHPWVRRLNLLAGILVLFLSQSKTAWGMYLLVLAYHGWARLRARPNGVRRMLGLALALGIVYLISLPFRPSSVRVVSTNSAQAQSLTSMTGRTEAWKITLDTWAKHPVFGYGIGIWDINFRSRWGARLIWAGQAHNQFIQTLGEAGTVGFLLLLTYTFLLLWHAWSLVPSARPVAFAAMMLIYGRSMTEACMRNYSVREDLLLHLIMLSTLIALSRALTVADRDQLTTLRLSDETNN